MKIKVRMHIIHWVKAKKRFADIALFRVHWNFEKTWRRYSLIEVELLGVSFIMFFKKRVSNKELREGIKNYFADREA